MKVKEITFFSGNKIASVLIAIFCLLNVFPVLFNITFGGKIVYIEMLLAFILFIASKTIFIKKTNLMALRKDKIIIFIIVFIVGGSLGVLYNGNMELTYLVWNFRYILIAYALIYYTLWEIPFYGLFYFLVVYFGYHIIVGTNVRELTHMVSYNNIPTYVIYYAILLIIVKAKQQKMPSILIPAFTFVISLWTGSRGSTLTTAIFLMLYIFISLHIEQEDKELGARKSGRKKNLLFIIAVVVGAASYLVSHPDMISNVLFNLQTKQSLGVFEKSDILFGIQNDIRFVMIMDYIKQCISNPVDMLLGADFMSVLSIKEWGEGNPHNSFIHAHGCYGLVFFIIIITAIIVSLYRLFHYNRMLFLAFLIVNLRSFYDITAFYGLYDLLFYFFFAIALCNKKYKRKEI